LLRGSRGNSETALAISGAARLTSQGSAAAVGVGVTIGAGVGWTAAGAALVTAGCCGVMETVESPDPHPATVSAATGIRAAHFTDAHRTVSAAGVESGARQDDPVVATRLLAR